MNKSDNAKRINPHFYQHDFHVLRRLYKLVLLLSKKIPQKSVVVDYGSGASPYEHLFNINKNRYLKLDIGANPMADIRIYENKPLPLKGGFADVVLSTQVLEHVNDLSLYLGEAERILKKNGVLILSTHGLWPYHESPRDYYRFTSFGLEKEIERNNFKIRKVYPILGPFAAVTQFSLLLMAQRLQRKDLITRIFMAAIAATGNILIWFEDILYPPAKNTDASVFLVLAQKK